MPPSGRVPRRSSVDQDAYDDLLQRLTALEAKTDARLAELQALNREQVATNQRLETLRKRAWRDGVNGQTD